MDSYERLMDKKRKLEIRQEDVELKMRLAYLKYKQQANLFKGTIRELNEIKQKVKDVMEERERDIARDWARER